MQRVECRMQSAEYQTLRVRTLHSAWEGVRSRNHLPKSVTAHWKLNCAIREPLQLRIASELFDLGSPLFIADPWYLLRKEVIQPQVPLRLPCYDFIPITIHTFGTCPSCELTRRLRVQTAFMM